MGVCKVKPTLSDMIRQLQEELGLPQDRALELVRMFFEQFYGLAEEMEASIRTGDQEKLKNLAHQCKGTAANLRMTSVAKAALRLEEAARNTDAFDSEEALFDLRDRVAGVQDEFVATHDLRPLDVLVVEDDPTGAALLETTIRDLGHRVVGLYDRAEAALLAVRREPPDLVFMDIGLASEMDGVHTAELIHSRYGTAVVFISACAERRQIDEAIRFGTGYIVKPFTRSEVAAMIRAAANVTEERRPVTAPDPAPSIQVREDNRTWFVPLGEIVYVEVQGHYLMLHTERTKHRIRATLKEVMALDERSEFIQPHRSYFVRRACITEIDRTPGHYALTLKNSTVRIPISRRNLHKFDDWRP